MERSKLDALVLSYEGDILSMMKRWIAIPSVQGEKRGDDAPFGKDVREMLNAALADARDMGFDVREFDGYAMHAQLGKGEKTMGILCHLDVVPAGDGWTRDPWGAQIEDGRVYGRGVADDKGAAICALFAMKAVREAGIPLKDGVRLILGCDEETGMSDMRYYASKCDLPDYGFSPDAEFPVINIEKGGLGLVLGKVTGGEDGAALPVYELYAGVRPNVVPGTAYAVVGAKDADALKAAIQNAGLEASVDDIGGGKCKIVTQGVSAHASMPHMGKNAAGMLLQLLKTLGAGGGSREAIAALSDTIGLEGNGESLGIACEDEISGKLTCNLGILRYDGHNLTAQLDIRYPLCANETVMIGQAAEAVSAARMYVAKIGSHAPHHVPADHKVVKGLLKVYGEVTGLPAYAFAIGGGTYSRCMPNTVAFGLTFPGDPETCHMPDEYIEIDKMMLSVRVMAHAIAELAGK